MRSVKARIALPEERCLASIVARSERLLILPDTANTKMILKVLSHSGKMLDDRYAQALYLSLITNARKHQHLWRVHRAQRQDNLEPSRDALNFSVKGDLYTCGSPSFESKPGNKFLREH